MDLRILLAVALVACAQAFEIRSTSWRERDSTQYLPATLERQLSDPNPSLNVPDVLTKDVKLGNVIDQTEPEIEERVRRSPKEPARGEIVVEGNARKGHSTGGKTEGQVYVGGRIRFRRSADEQTENIVEETEPETEGRVRRSPKEPARGEIVVEGNARKGHSTGGKTEGQVYVGGRIRFRRSADEQTENIVEETEPETEGRVRRSPKEPVTGKIVVSGNARKGYSTGGKTEGQIYVGGQVRFRRSEDDSKHTEEIIDQVDNEYEGTRVRRSPKKKGSGRLILRGEAGQSTGRKADVGVHLIGEYRFRRSADEQNENIVEETEPETEGRVRRSPKEPVTGKIVVSGNARKGSSTGGKTEGQIYVGGQVRFRRSEDDSKHTEEIIDQVDNEYEGTRVRRSPKKKGSGRLIIRGEAGQSTGRRADVGAHLIGEYRFRRSADEQNENIVEETEPETEGRVRRSPKEPVTGKIVVSGNARKGSSTGGKTEGQIYVGGQVRFRRSEDDSKHTEEIIDQVDNEYEGTRVRRSPKKKGSGRLIIRGEAGQSTGRRADVGAHLIGEYRFRRSAEQELAQH